MKVLTAHGGLLWVLCHDLNLGCDKAHIITKMVQLILLPSGWIDITSGADQLSLCHIVRPPAAGLPTVDFTLIINTNLSWKLYFFKQRVEIDRCPTFATTSTNDEVTNRYHECAISH